MAVTLAFGEAALIFSALLALLGCPAGVSLAQASCKPLMLTVACTASFYCCDLYDLHVVRNLPACVPRLLRAIGLVLLAFAVVEMALPTLALASKMPLTTVLLAMVGLPLGGRALLYGLIRTRPYRQRVLVLGGGRMAMTLLAELATRPYLRWAVRLLAETSGAPRTAPPPPAVLGGLEALEVVVQRMRPHRIIVALDEQRRADVMPALLEARGRGIVIEDAVDVYERIAGKLAIEALPPANLVFSKGFRLNRGHATIGRLLSLLAAAVGLALTGPLLGLIALAVKLDSRGPVFFRQERIGLYAKRFWLIKFRTMRPAASEASLWVRDNTDRITRVGRVLRKYRLDELPQFWNVLRGDMNLVGPRPHPVGNYELFVREIPYYSLRAAVRPGLTGWAQVRYGYANNLEEETEKMRFDLYYVKHLSVWLDIRILVDTVKVIAFGQGSSAADMRPAAAPGLAESRPPATTEHAA
jgi:exopolysaccharide biosynthesis polyprenyl glycosylphosphotransferase